MSFTYLASPYSHDDPAVRAARYHEALDCVAWMIGRKIWVYSPIAHCHEVALRHGTGTDHASYIEYNHAMIEASRSLLILAIDGWRESAGVADERRHAAFIGRPVSYAIKLRDGYDFTTERPRS